MFPTATPPSSGMGTVFILSSFTSATDHVNFLIHDLKDVITSVMTDLKISPLQTSFS